MTKVEMAKLLTIYKSLKDRPMTEEEIAAWHVMVGDLPFEDALEAMRRHVRDSEAWLQPVHLVRGVDRIAYERRKIAWVRRALESARESDPDLDEDRWWLRLSRDDGVSAFVRDFAASRLPQRGALE